MSAIEFSTSRENISSNGGLSFVEGLPSSTGAMPLWDKAPPHRGNARFSHQAIVRALVGLLSAGCGNFADIEKFSDAPVFLSPVGEGLPSQKYFRQRIALLLKIGRNFPLLSALRKIEAICRTSTVAKC